MRWTPSSPAEPPQPHDSAIASLDLARRDTPFGTFIEVQPDGSTSHSRVFAAGNVVNPMATVPVSMAEGATAGARANAFLVEPRHRYRTPRARAVAGRRPQRLLGASLRERSPRVVGPRQPHAGRCGGGLRARAFP
ncbi:hypothetical protein [Demequina litorisediminis]|uniref:hypothetical protein n=1 Tax=Demequina litorisediminis TaxID=1849022 RepID=UPI0024E162D1|nr:hypothetical protein [Demequina litorisediminis]